MSVWTITVAWLVCLGVACGAVEVPSMQAFAPSPRLIMAHDDLVRIRADMSRSADSVRSQMKTYLFGVADFAQDSDILSYAQITADFETRFPAPRSADSIGDQAIRTARRVQGLILTWAMASRIAEVVDGDLVKSEQYGRLAIRQMAMVAGPDFPWDRAKAAGLNGTFLSVAELMLGVAIGFDWLADKNAWWIHNGIDQRPLVAKALYEKGLKLGREAYAATPSTYTSSWVKGAYNWTQVCNAGLLASALALANRAAEVGVSAAALEADIALTVQGACESLGRAQTLYQPAGVYAEGLAYWSYGTTYQVLAIAMLESALKNSPAFQAEHVQPLWDNPGFKGTGFFRTNLVGPTGLQFTYSDVGINPEALTGNDHAGAVLSWIGWKQESREIMAYSRRSLARRLPGRMPSMTDSYLVSPSRIGDGFFFNYLAYPLHYLWLPAPDVIDADPSTGSGYEDHLFHGKPLGNRDTNAAEFAVFSNRPGTTDDWWLAVKAGGSGLSHSHHDLGSFVFEYQGFRWAADLGSDDDGRVVNGVQTYGDDDQGGQRWDYLLCGTQGHNVLAPGGMQQFIVGLAPITSFSSTATEGSCAVDLTGVYPSTATRIARGIALVNQRRQLVVQDDVQALSPGVPLMWRMMTRASVTSSDSPRTLILTQSTPTPTARTATLLMEVLRPTNATITVEAVNDLPNRIRTFDGYSRITVSVPPQNTPRDEQVVVRFRSPSASDPLSLPRPRAWEWTPATGTPVQVPSITARTSILVTPGAPVAVALTAVGAPWTTGWTTTSLPAWLRLDPATGGLSGMVPATLNTSVSFDVSVTNAAGSDTARLTLAPPAVAFPRLNFVTTPVTFALNGTSQRKALVLQIPSSRPSSIQYQGLPPGLRGTVFFQLDGTPTVAGVYQVQVEAQYDFGTVRGTVGVEVIPSGTTTLPSLSATPTGLNLP